MHLYLEATISTEEMERAKRNAKNMKSPGLDGISYEFHKNLPQNWKLYVQSYYFQESYGYGEITSVLEIGL